MKLRITFLLVILILAVATSAKKSLTKVKKDVYPTLEPIFAFIANLDSEEEDVLSEDPIGQALYHCINTNYQPWDRDHQDFVHLVDNRCQHFDREEDVVAFYHNTLNCVENISAPRQSVKVQFVATIQCVFDQFCQVQKQDLIWLQKKKPSLKSQNKLKRRRV
ncbi:hypothetical protein TTHERM_00404320 (macronuclear) [Tetrahymena thermophila SB210]|uniref:Transmembrane protein n=1 Tax=Tetrahymena thermophila (strain SB210) TaxID=312017 RepID=I7ME18_TETTS|nr:hypothetical protein TTHERM_00404320 [Tetrahymena thermophila SB210]EAR93862.1 hypothetical protein TTHERM_00404320 [Tetrahymena thermophila SB210]|eukprot:XP_001014107.1 hypothetical protein TTHERM_00404320 [Tetrahymena thermophila SB210]